MTSGSNLVTRFLSVIGFFYLDRPSIRHNRSGETSVKTSCHVCLDIVFFFSTALQYEFDEKREKKIYIYTFWIKTRLASLSHRDKFGADVERPEGIFHVRPRLSAHSSLIIIAGRVRAREIIAAKTEKRARDLARAPRLVHSSFFTSAMCNVTLLFPVC